MKFLLFYTFLISLLLFSSYHCGILEVSKKFPIEELEEYPINFKTTTKTIPLYSIIILKCYVNEILRERRVLYPGNLKQFTKMWSGDYFSVLRYSAKPYVTKIVLAFKRSSNGANLNILYHETNSTQVLNNLENDSKQFSKVSTTLTLRITLRLGWILEIIRQTLNQKEGGYLIDSIGILLCRASKGSPFSPAILSGVDTLKEVLDFGVIANEYNNVAEIVFIPKIEDHMKIVSCTAGTDNVSAEIMIFHHPTKINFLPPVTEYMKNGTTIVCKADDGFPLAKTTWKFLKGPKHPYLYYSINEADNTLHIKRNAPDRSKWTFQCSATNNILNSLDGRKTETVRFIIGDKPTPVILIASLVLISVSLVSVIAICLCCYLSSKIIDVTIKDSPTLPPRDISSCDNGRLDSVTNVLKVSPAQSSIPEPSFIDSTFCTHNTRSRATNNPVDFV